MNRIGVFYGTTSGNTEAVAGVLAKALGEKRVELHDIAQSGFAGIEKYDLVIFGISTWNEGNLQADWETRWAELDAMDFTNTCVALFGVGDQFGYPETYLGALAKLYRRLLARGAKIIGSWPANGYNFRHSEALFDDGKTFVGLALDEESQGDLTARRVARWAAQLQAEFGAGKGVNLSRYLLDAHPDSDRVAYFYGEKQISLGELRRMVAALASRLQTVLAPGERAVFALNDSPLQIAAFLACIAVGAVPAVANPRLPTEQIKELVDTCDARLLAIENDRTAESAHFLEGNGRLRLAVPFSDPALASLDDWIASGDSEWRDYVSFAGDQPSYLQFTSGSTGKAKAVVHTFNNTIAICQLFAAEHLHIGPSDVIYAVPKIFFGYGMGGSLFFPLYTGAAAVLDSSWPTPDCVRRNLVRFRPTVFFAVPAMYRAFRADAELVVGSVRLAVSAGSSLPAVEFLYWRERGVEICDGIGATELCHIFLANRPGQARPGCTGKPLQGIECRLVDEQGKVVTDVDDVGILLVKGPMLAKGYWGQEAATAERFVDGWYRTGDLFSIDADGFYSHHGREDDLFKVNGRWVTPLPVEKAVCEAFPAVAEAVLVPSTREHDALPPTLFVTAADSTAESVGSLIEGWLEERFPSHIRPRKVISIEGMPRNHSGKLMRSALIQRAQQSLPLEA